MDEYLPASAPFISPLATIQERIIRVHKYSETVKVAEIDDGKRNRKSSN